MLDVEILSEVPGYMETTEQFTYLTFSTQFPKKVIVFKFLELIGNDFWHAEPGVPRNETTLLGLAFLVN